MVINYQDPLDVPFKKPSQRRHLRGTWANRNTTILSAALVGAGSLVAFTMYLAVPQKKKDYLVDNPEALALFTNKSVGLIAYREEPEFSHEINQAYLATEEVTNPENWRFWKPSFWLDHLFPGSKKQPFVETSQEASKSE